MVLSVASFIVLITLVFGETTLADPPTIEQPSCGDIDVSSGLYPNFVCKGEGPTSRCFCCGSTSHLRIFGWSWTSNAKNMTCACSRQREAITRSDVSLHCTENGNYDKLQCDNDMCWCVSPSNGKPTERVYPRSMMQHLPCYSQQPKELRQRYQRQCESAALARMIVLRKLEAHGTYSTYIEKPMCDYDGTYATHKLNKRDVYCAWKDGKKIDLYQSSVADIARTNCYCARDSVIYADEDIGFLITCAGNGNYDHSQISNGMPYCVDDDGFATTEMDPNGSTLKCP